MIKYTLFIQALLLHLDQLEALLGERWSAMRDKLLPLLADVIHEDDPGKLAARVHRVYRALKGTPAEALARELFRQASDWTYNLEHSRKQILFATDRDESAVAVDLKTVVQALARAIESLPEGATAEMDLLFHPTLPETQTVTIRPNFNIAVIGNKGTLYQMHAQLTFGNRTDWEAAITPREPQTMELSVTAPGSAAGGDFSTIGTEDIKYDTIAPEHAIEPASVEAATEMDLLFPPAPPDAQTVTTHPNLLGDDHAYLGKLYRLVVKLSDQPQPLGASLFAPELEVPVKAGEIVKKIQVRLAAPDFDLDANELARGWLREINFYPEAAASNAITFTLLPQDRSEDRYFSTLRVQFELDGQVLGHAARKVEVLRDEAVAKTPLSAFPPAPGYPLDERGEVRVQPIPTPVSVVTGAPGVHLTITISETKPQEQLLWEIASPYLKANDFPAGDYFSNNLGVEEFVKKYLAPFGMPGKWPEDHMEQTGCLKAQSIPILYNNLLTLRGSAPPQFWKLYEVALERHLVQGGTTENFAILFITADTHIPWELMPVSKEVIGDKMPLLLGSAHCVGRWLLETGSPIPEAALDLHGFVLETPTYTDQPLPQAQAEKQFLKERYKPYELPDQPDAFITFMKTGLPTNGTGILHFAGHGDCCTDEMRGNWLVLTNREALYDIRSASNNLGNSLGKLHPIFAFFNACNVGRAALGPLGSNGGWGRALLNQQYKGYIGPLWSVYDQHARDISETFYTLALDKSLPLGEVMRRIRARFSEDNRLFTYLAYLYLGHPLARITYTPFKE